MIKKCRIINSDNRESLICIRKNNGIISCTSIIRNNITRACLIKLTVNIIHWIAQNGKWCTRNIHIVRHVNKTGVYGIVDFQAQLAASVICIAFDLENNCRENSWELIVISSRKAPVDFSGITCIFGINLTVCLLIPCSSKILALLHTDKLKLLRII